MKFYFRFITCWIINSFLIYLASIVFPYNFVLGTYNLSVLAAVVISGFLLTVLCKILGKVIRMAVKELKGRVMLFLFYWLINSAGIWLIARLAPYTGLGITAFYWAVVLGFATNLMQWVTRQLLKTAKLVDSK